MRLEADRSRAAYGLPTWFPEDSGAEEPPRPRERATNWHPPAPRLARRPTDSASYSDEVAEVFEPRRRMRPPRQPSAPLHHMAKAAAAGFLSVVIGALSALVVYDITSGGSVRAVISAIFTGSPLPANGAESTTVVPKKVVITARVDALDVSGNADAPIPLALKAEAGEPDQPVALKLSGLPRDAYLTAGTKLDSNDWLLKPGQELGVKLVVPEAPPLPLSLAVAAIEPTSGELVAPVREFTVAVAPNPEVKIVPANAPPEGRTDFAVKTETPAAAPIPAATPAALTALPAAAPIPEPASEADTLIQRGDILMKSGELVAARPFYERAIELGGGGDAAFRLAQTYDPEVFAQNQVRGLRPDPVQALKYYQQAAAGGIAEAQAAIGRLGTQ
jgi:hypothetical protein